MHTNDFETAFDEYLEGEGYEQASEKLFAAARDAFEAGWTAALRTIPLDKKIYPLKKTEKK